MMLFDQNPAYSHSPLPAKQHHHLPPVSWLQLASLVENLHAGGAQNFDHASELPVMDLQSDHVSWIRIATADDTARSLRHGRRRNVLTVSVRLIRKDWNQRIPPLVHIAFRNLARCAAPDAQIEKEFSVRFDFSARRLVAELNVAAHRQRPGVRIHPEQLLCNRPTYVALHIGIRNLRVALHERNPLVNVLNRLPYHRGDLLDG